MVSPKHAININSENECEMEFQWWQRNAFSFELQAKHFRILLKVWQKFGFFIPSSINILFLLFDQRNKC